MTKRVIIGLVGLAVVGAAGLAWNGREAAPLAPAKVAAGPLQAAGPLDAARPAAASVLSARSGDRVLTIADLARVGAIDVPAGQGANEQAVEQPTPELTREQARSRLLAPVEQRPLAEQRTILEQSLSVAQGALESTRGSLAALEQRAAAGDDVTQLISLVRASVGERERSVHELKARLANFSDMAAAAPAER